MELLSKLCRANVLTPFGSVSQRKAPVHLATILTSVVKSGPESSTVHMCVFSSASSAFLSTSRSEGPATGSEWLKRHTRREDVLLFQIQCQDVHQPCDLLLLHYLIGPSVSARISGIEASKHTFTTGNLSHDDRDDSPVQLLFTERQRMDVGSIK